MHSRYDVGDKVLLVGTVKKIEQYPNGKICYTLKEYGVLMEEDTILAKVSGSWDVREKDGTRMSRSRGDNRGR